MSGEVIASPKRWVYLGKLQRLIRPDLREILPDGRDGCPGGCKGDHLKLDFEDDDGTIYALRLLCLGSKAVRLWADFKARNVFPISAGATPSEAAIIITKQWGYASNLIEKITIEAANFAPAPDLAEMARMKEYRKAMDTAAQLAKAEQEAHAKGAFLAFMAGNSSEEGMKMNEVRDSFAVYRIYDGRPGAVWDAVRKYLSEFDPLGYGTSVTWESSGKARIQRWASCE